jgi:hypothetical protein
MRNRYYDPQTGRFTQQDPIGLAGGMNLYGFAEGDPINFSDPYGLFPILPRLVELARSPGVQAAASAYGQRFTAFYGNLARTAGARLNNLVGHVTEREHLSTTAREASKRLQTGWDHVGETIEKMNGVRNLLPRIEKALSDPRVQGELRGEFEALMSKASQALDMMERAVRGGKP